MKKQILMLLLTALGLFALPRTADACSCIRGLVLPPVQFGPSDVVFLGRVVQSQPLAYVALDVLETFNGQVGRRVRVPTGRNDCDYFLPPVETKSGTQFLVYGTIHEDGILEVNRCLGSGPSNVKTRELEILRQRAQRRPSSGGKLILGRAERYTIEQRQEGVVLTMRQGRQVLLVGLFCAGVLLLTWWYGPYGPQTAPAFRGEPGAFYWVWSGFFACAFLVSLLVAPFYRWKVTITQNEIIATTSQYWWKQNRRMPRGQALGIWTEVIDHVDEGVMFPYRVHLLDAEGRVSGIYAALQKPRGPEQLLEALRTAVTLDVKDRRPR